MALSRTYDRLFGAASIATLNSSSVAFSAFGCSSGLRNTHVQPQVRLMYKANFAYFLIGNFFRESL